MITARYLESVLVNYPGVKEVCAMPPPAPNPGYDCLVFVSLVHNTPSAIYEFQSECAGFLEGLAVKMSIVPELPRSRMGRVAREELLARFGESAA